MAVRLCALSCLCVNVCWRVPVRARQKSYLLPLADVISVPGPDPGVDVARADAGHEDEVLPQKTGQHSKSGKYSLFLIFKKTGIMGASTVYQGPVTGWVAFIVFAIQDLCQTVTRSAKGGYITLSVGGLDTIFRIQISRE